MSSAAVGHTPCNLVLICGNGKGGNLRRNGVFGSNVVALCGVQYAACFARQAALIISQTLTGFSSEVCSVTRLSCIYDTISAQAFTAIHSCGGRVIYFIEMHAVRDKGITEYTVFDGARV